MKTPTEAELDLLWSDSDIGPESEVHRQFARAVLAKWGQPQAGASGNLLRAAAIELRDAPDLRAMQRATAKLYAAIDTAPPPQAVREPLAEARILEVVGLAPDRKVCASTCMTAKFDKKPCQCYPTSASRSEVVAIARAVESAHGITKGGQHG